MANTLDPMDLKQIISLHQDGLSNRKISATLGIARNTVNNYIQAFKASDHTFKELLACDNAVLETLFASHTTIDNKRFDRLTRYFERMNKARDHPGFTFLFHYQEYVQQVEDPYGYTQFMEHYHRKYAKLKGSMKLEHGPGHELFIDFAGKKLHMVDRGSGEIVDVEVFVAILPNSHYTYVEACRSQKREDLSNVAPMHCNSTEEFPRPSSRTISSRPSNVRADMRRISTVVSRTSPIITIARSIQPVGTHRRIRRCARMR